MGEQMQAISSSLKASAILEDLVRVDPTNAWNRSLMSAVFMDLGDDEVAIAQQPKTPARDRISHWRSARAWYVKSDRVFGDLVAEGKSLSTTVAIDTENGERPKKQMALCDEALAAGATGRNSPGPTK
jgi:hypothetical protein